MGRIHKGSAPSVTDEVAELAASLRAVELEHLVTADAKHPLQSEGKVYGRHTCLVGEHVPHGRHTVEVLLQKVLL